MNEHSPKFDMVRKFYRTGRWSENAVRKAVERGWITQEECEEILGEVTVCEPDKWDWI